MILDNNESKVVLPSGVNGTVAKFAIGNLLARTTGLVLPPYWLKNHNQVDNVSGYEGFLGSEINDISGYAEVDLGDTEVKELIRHNALGYPMCMPLEIEIPETGEMWTLPIEPTISITGKNIITRRRVAKSVRRGTIKEFWVQDDYSVSIQGLLMDIHNPSQYPRKDMEQLRAICEARQELKVNCYLLDVFGITRIVIEDFEMPFTKGENAQDYTIKAYSDDLFDLLIDKTVLK